MFRGTHARTAAIVFGVIAFIYLGFEVDGGIRAVRSAGLLTAHPARFEIAVVVAGFMAIAVVSQAPAVRLRMLAVLGPGVAVLAVLVATATAGGQAGAMLDAVLTMSALWLTGERLLTALRLPQLASRGAVAWVAGLGPLCLLSIVLGRVTLFRWWDVGLLVALLGVAGLARGVMLLWPKRATIGSALVENSTSAVCAGTLLLTFAVASFYTSAPEIQFDPLYGKAYLPALWARTGHIGPLNAHIQLNITGWFQLVAAFGNLLGNAATGRYLQLLAFAFVPVAIWSFGRARGVLAPVAALAVGAVPMLFWQATTADDDLLIAFSVIGIVIAVLTAFGREFPGSDRTTGLALGLLAGTGVSIKTHVIPLAVALLAGWVLSGGPGLRPKLERAAWACTGLVITGVPPFALRWIDTGNPVFPAYNNIFKSPYWLPVNATLNFPFWMGAGVSGFIRAPFESVFDPGLMGEDIAPGALGALAGLVLVAVLIGWRWRRRVPGSMVAWCALIIAILVWWKEFRYLRYFLPEGMLAVLLLLAAGSKAYLPTRAAARAAISTCVVLLAGAYLTVSIADMWNVPHQRIPIKAALGLWNANDYLTQVQPDRPAVLAFDRLSSPNAVELANGNGGFERTWLTGNRNLYVPWEASSLFEAHHTPTTTTALSMIALRRLGIDWVLTNPSDGAGSAVPLDGAEVRSEWLPALLAKDGQVRYAANGWTLYQLGSHPRPARPLAPCDRHGSGMSASCWAGTRNSSGEIDTTASRALAICPGEILDLAVTQAVSGAAESVTIVMPQAGALDEYTTGMTIPGATSNIYATALGASTEASVDINDPAAAKITGARVETIGSCSRQDAM